MNDETFASTFASNMSPPKVNAPSDNLKNLFEMPVLFYALASMLFVTEQVDSGYVVAAWVFAAFRIAHSAVHCTVNIVMLRFGAANRDERQFAHPDSVDLDRKNPGAHFAFGSGVHHCPGAPLARQELNRGFLALMDRIERVRMSQHMR